MTKETTKDMDGGQKAFCEGIIQIGERTSPGLGSFIEQCVRKAMEEKGLRYQETVKKKPARRSKKSNEESV